MNMTENFTLGEMIFSQAAVRNNLDNQPDADALDNLLRTCTMLEQVRKLVGKPIQISSGYRSPAVNKAVGGSANSAHVKGLAADITVKGITARNLAMLIRESGIVFDQLIYEGTWVHIGLAEGKPRRRVLTAIFADGGVRYSEGIV